MYYYDLESYTKSLFGSEADYFFLCLLLICTFRTEKIDNQPDAFAASENKSRLTSIRNNCNNIAKAFILSAFSFCLHSA